MAGVNWEKIKQTQRAKFMGHIKHNSKDTRLVNRHKNDHIDKTLTPNNLQTVPTAEEIWQRFKNRLAEVEGSNKRRDRVEAVELEIPIPDEITKQGHEKEKEWLGEVHTIMKEFCGKENIVYACCHFDERHEYVDKDTKQVRTSLNHVHYAVVPEMSGKLHAKSFCARGRIIQLNNQIEEMSILNFGVRFNDGTKKKSKDSVEHLKQASKTAEIELKLQQTENLLLLAEKRENELNTQVQAIKQKQEAAEMLANEYFEKLEAVLPLRDMLQDVLDELNKIMPRERARMTLDRFVPTVQSVNKALEELGQDQIDMGIDDEEIDR